MKKCGHPVPKGQGYLLKRMCENRGCTDTREALRKFQGNLDIQLKLMHSLASSADGFVYNVLSVASSSLGNRFMSSDSTTTCKQST